MTTTELATKTAELETKLRAMEVEIAELRERQERSELEAIERRGDEQVARGQTMPARQAIEMLRRKHNIPTS
jgi:hypothetical protein